MKVLVIYNIYPKATEKNIKTLLKKKIKNLPLGLIQIIKINDGFFQINGNIELLSQIKNRLDHKKYHNKILHVGYAIINEQNFQNIKEYVYTFLLLLEMERFKEKNQVLNELQNLNEEQRIKLGKTLINMNGFYKEEILQGYLYRFVKNDKSFLPDNNFLPGDIITVSKGNPLFHEYKEGVCYGVSQNSIYLVFNKKLPKNLKKNVRIDKFFNEINYERMESNLIMLLQNEYKKDIILHGENTINNDKISIPFKELNSSQKQAIIQGLNSKNYFLIHGPPGTGKTKTLSYLVKYLYEKTNYKVLISADSNVAIDVFSKYLLDLNVDFIRIGQSVKIDPKIISHTLNEKVKEEKKFKEALQLEIEIEKLIEKMNNYEAATMKNRRGYSFEQILTLAKKQQTGRGIPMQMISSMSHWIKLKIQLDNVYHNYRQLKEEAANELLLKTPIILTTNSMAGSELLKKFHFDYVIIDEATQSTEPSTLMPFLKGDKIILAGDHKQLPPVVLNKKAAKEGLEISLFERLYNINAHNSIMLNIQYRMNNFLNDIISYSFYNGKLKSDCSVKKHFYYIENINPKYEQIFGKNAKPFIFINTIGIEKHMSNSYSYYNEKEAQIIIDLLSVLKNHDCNESIGIITGYKDQKKYLLSLLNDITLNLIVDTVDGFQGGEKDIILFSLVRSNDKNDTGFLHDKRRLNVALSRAKKKLIIIGNMNIFKKIFPILCDKYHNTIDFLTF